MSDSQDGGGDMASEDRKLIEKLLLSGVQEQRRARRWSIFFRILFMLWLFTLVGSIIFSMNGRPGKPSPSEYAALIDIKGAIASDREANADSIATALRRAYEDKKVRGIILRINSPGGSPVQASYIYDEVNRLKKSRPDLQVYAVISDLGASAAYYIASAADHIYASRSSMVGSIGAYIATFGVDKAMEKLGVTRRFYGSGEHKALIDPFQPEDEVAARHLRATVKNIHDHFIESVQAGRGERLKESPELFTGLVWTGEQALELGLIDGLGSPGYVAREVIGHEGIVDFTVKPGLFERFADRVGTSAAQSLSATLGLGGPAVR